VKTKKTLNMHSLPQPLETNIAPCIIVKQTSSPTSKRNWKYKPTTKNNLKHNPRSSATTTTHIHIKKEKQNNNKIVLKRLKKKFVRLGKLKYV
jgi:hypothetical protein